MPAPDLTTCLKVRDAIATGFVTVLDNAINVPVIPDHSTTEKTTPRIEVGFELDGATGHYGKGQDGIWRHDMFDARLTCRVVTNRSDSTQAGQSADLIAAIREALQPSPTTFDSTLLPYHCVVDAREQSGGPGIQESEDQDTTDIIYSVVCGIRPDAWPAV